MPVRGVDDEYVDAGLDQQHRPLPGVAEETDRRADHEPALRVLGGHRELLALHEVLDRDEAGEPAVLVDQRQLLDLVPAQERHRVVGRDARGPVTSGIGVMTSTTGGEWSGSKRMSRLVTMPSSMPLAVDHGRTRDAVAPAQRVDLGQGGVRTDGDRVGDHAGLGALDEVDLCGLVLDRQVAVQHADATLAGHGDRHAGLGDGVHGRRDERHAQRDVAGEAGGRVDVAGHDVGAAGQQQDVVVGQSERGELVGNAAGHGLLDAFRSAEGWAAVVGRGLIHGTGAAAERQADRGRPYQANRVLARRAVPRNGPG